MLTRIYGRECIFCVVLEVHTNMSEHTASSFKFGALEKLFCFLVSHVFISPFLLAGIGLHSYSPTHNTNRPFTLQPPVCNSATSRSLQLVKWRS